ncbi:MAG: transporter [Acidobacteria bacterium]|nr:transporter [Acidobacteriota bacterium]
MLRVEWGFTNRLELDLEFPFTGMKEELDGATLSSEFGFSDALVGLRYRLLTEENFPLTLTVGPQIIFPTGDFSRGRGLGSTGVALDLSAAKDWGGPFFLYSSLNYALFPSVDVPPLGLNPATDFALGNLAYGTALGIRALEKPSGGAHHDLHAFLELGVERSEELELDLAGAFTTYRTAAVFAPGIRYGFLSSGKKLFEVGVAVPIGLNDEAPRAAVIFQVQFEQFVNF